MNTRLALLLLASLAVISGIVWFTYSENQSGLVRLQGEVLKVRTYQLDPSATLVFADFRITNPTDSAFTVESLEMELVPKEGEPLEGGVLTKREIDQVFAYQKLSGPQYNDPLIVRDRIEPGETQDRMAVARFDVPESAIDARGGLQVRIHEIDGQASEIVEKR